MPVSFLLRFQEPVAESDGGLETSGTQTVTRVRGEQPDSDPGEASIVTIPRSLMPSDEISLTKFQTDAGEYVEAMRSKEAILKEWHAGTRTVTNVRAEADDNDPGTTIMRMVPRCCSS